jgi:hypothetical protein
MSEKDRIIDRINDLPINFFLTGSKFFGCDITSSDTDLFTADDPDVEPLLVKLGFQKMEAGSNPDYVGIQDTSAIYEHTCGIHVQLVGDVPKKRRAQDLVALICPGERMNKNFVKETWNRIYGILNKEYSA